MVSICVLIFLLTPLSVFAYEEKCPNVTLPADLHKFKRQLSARIYDEFPVEDYDEDTEVVIEKLRCLSESLDIYKSGIAYVVSVWLSTFTPYLDRLPPFCAHAKLINATVSKDPDDMIEALTCTGVHGHVMNCYRQQNAIRACGCECSPIIDHIHFDSCWKDGFVYEMDALWKIRGKVLPECFRKIVRRLYKSKFLVNRLIAILLSYTITDQAEGLIRHKPYSGSVMSTWLQFSCQLPKHCCEQRLALLDSLNKDVADKVVKVFDDMKPPCIFPSLNVSSENYQSFLRNTSKIIMDRFPANVTEKGRAVHDELREMLDSGNSNYVNIASTALNAYDVLSKNLENSPSLCAYAAFINETAACDNKKISEALDGVSLFVEHYHYLVHERGISACGCPCDPIPKPPIAAPSGCYQDGYAYNVRRIWCLMRRKVPCYLPRKVIALYRSKNQLDKLLAATLTFAVADPTLETVILDEVIYKAINSKFSDKIRRCGCPERLAELAQIEHGSCNCTMAAIENFKKTL